MGIEIDEFNESFDLAAENLLTYTEQRIILIYRTTQKDDCPNCKRLPTSRRSANIYDSSNPNVLNGPLHKVFTNGNVCPICKGRGFIENAVPNQDIINCAVVENPSMSDLKALTRDTILDNKTIIYILGRVADIPKIKSADHLMVDGQKCLRLGNPAKLGFKNKNFYHMLLEVE